MRFTEQDFKIILHLTRNIAAEWWREQTSFDRLLLFEIISFLICIWLIVFDSLHWVNAPWSKTLVLVLPGAFLLFNAIFGPLFDNKKIENAVETPIRPLHRRTRPKLYIVPKDPDQSA